MAAKLKPIQLGVREDYLLVHLTKAELHLTFAIRKKQETTV